MNHIHIMLLRNLDDLVAGEVGSHGCILSLLANDIGFIGLLPVHPKAILIAEDGHGVERQLMGSSEDANGDLSSIGDYTPRTKSVTINRDVSQIE